MLKVICTSCSCLKQTLTGEQTLIAIDWKGPVHMETKLAGAPAAHTNPQPHILSCMLAGPSEGRKD